MKFANGFLACAFVCGCVLTAHAGEASSWANAGSPGYGPGTAAAGANYAGNGIGITHTTSRSGDLNFAQGTSVGFDENGISLSTSYALAPTRGPAAAGTLNMHIGANGETAASVGRSVSLGDRDRSVNVSGVAGERYGEAFAGATAGGHAGSRGRVIAATHSDHRRSPLRAAREGRTTTIRRAVQAPRVTRFR